MSTAPQARSIDKLRRLVSGPGEPSDARLLRRYILERDEAAFEALVRRHGPMVMGVCRRVLGASADVDDAFQATFLVLVKKAAAITKAQSLGSWLHGVAYRVSAKANTLAARRRNHERRAAIMTATGPDREAAVRELRPVLDEELARLPAHYREPLILCYLQGKSKDEIARKLGWPHGTVSGRLARARELLRGRLAKRGLALPGALLLAALPTAAASAAVSPVLIATTLQAAGAFAAGSLAAGAVSAQAVTLTQGVLYTMMLSKLKLVIALAATLGLLSTGIGVAGWYAWGKGTDSTAPAIGNGAAPNSTPASVMTGQTKADQDKLLGKWHVIEAELGGKKPEGEQGEEMRSAQFEFTQGDMTISFFGEGMKFGYKLDTTKKPRIIEMTNPKKNESIKGIYALDGDSLKLCISNRGPQDPVPTEFKTRDGDQYTLFVLKRGDAPKPPPGTEDKVKEAANRRISQNNLKQIALAFHNYHNTMGAFPAGAIHSNTGKPLLSWRVAILPYLDQDALYKSFKLDEPWDSTHNKKLMLQMPKVYELPGKKAEKAHTFYRVFTGKNSLFDGDTASKLQTVLDGTSNTILAVEAGESVEWTRPDDLVYDDAKPLPKLGGYFSNGFNIAMCDGSVRLVRQDIDADVFRLFIKPADGTPVDFEKLNPKKK